MNDFTVTDFLRETDANFPVLIHRKCTLANGYIGAHPIRPPPILELQLEIFPQNMTLRALTLPLEIVYRGALVARLMDFFAPLFVKEEIVQAASAGVEILKRESKASMQQAIDTHKKVFIDVVIGAPIFFLPLPASFLILDLGQIKISTLPHESFCCFLPATSVDSRYDTYHISIDDIQVLLSTPVPRVQWQQALISTHPTPLHLLERTSLQIHVQQCVAQTSMEHVRLKLTGCLKRFHIQFSNAKYRLLLDVVQLFQSGGGVEVQNGSNTFGSAKSNHGVPAVAPTNLQRFPRKTASSSNPQNLSLHKNVRRSGSRARALSMYSTGSRHSFLTARGDADTSLSQSVASAYFTDKSSAVLRQLGASSSSGDDDFVSATEGSLVDNDSVNGPDESCLLEFEDFPEGNAGNESDPMLGQFANTLEERGTDNVLVNWDSVPIFSERSTSYTINAHDSIDVPDLPDVREGVNVFASFCIEHVGITLSHAVPERNTASALVEVVVEGLLLVCIALIIINRQFFYYDISNLSYMSE